MRATLEVPPANQRVGAAGVARSPHEDARLPMRGRRSLFAVAIFLGAFLLFQVQLLLGKQILPLFGGAPAVWTACLLVFQLLLLAGYAYAHGIAGRVTLRKQVILQISVLGASPERPSTTL